MVEKAYAKINLTLDIVGKREDGYHDIKTVMQTVSLCDILEVEQNIVDTISITTDKRYIPTDKRNLIYKACEHFFEATGIKSGVKINLIKHIPVAAGLAGGSSDAAATLRVLNRLFKTGLSDEKLCEIGAAFGADIPFCIKGGTALCEGIGEIITQLKPLPKMNLVISIGGEGMSTLAMYAEIDNKKELKKIDTDSMLHAIHESKTTEIIAKIGNVFEEICSEKRPFVTQIKKQMLENGALGAVMSGSGPSVYGFFPDKESVVHCTNKLKDAGYYAFHCTTI